MKRIIFITAVLALFLWGCSSRSNEKKSSDIFAMDTYMNMQVYGENADIALDKAEKEIYRLEKLFSVTDDSSEVYKINNSGGKKIEITEDVRSLIEFSENMRGKTDGCFDIRIYPILKEWGFTTGDYKIPDSERIVQLKKITENTEIFLEEEFLICSENGEIDFGAVAKGYTSDRIAEIFRENGIESAIINLGGNVHAFGKKPDNSFWNVAVTDPFSPDKTLGIVRVSDKAVITSGDYQRYFTGDDGRKYCHIIDPTTGYPAENGLVSVTVIGENGLLCDALSTAFFVMGREKTEVYLKNQSEVSVLLVQTDGTLVISEEITDYFENHSDYPIEVIENEN